MKTFFTKFKADFKAAPTAGKVATVAIIGVVVTVVIFILKKFKKS